MLLDPVQQIGSDISVVFEVIAPSIPGFGWSSSPMKKGKMEKLFGKITLTFLNSIFTVTKKKNTLDKLVRLPLFLNSYMLRLQCATITYVLLAISFDSNQYVLR